MEGLLYKGGGERKTTKGESFELFFFSGVFQVERLDI